VLGYWAWRIEKKATRARLVDSAEGFVLLDRQRVESFTLRCFCREFPDKPCLFRQLDDVKKAAPTSNESRMKVE
jgi:hypothetical protein